MDRDLIETLNAAEIVVGKNPEAKPRVTVMPAAAKVEIDPGPR